MNFDVGPFLMLCSCVLQVGASPVRHSLSRPLPGVCCTHLPPFVVKFQVVLIIFKVKCYHVVSKNKFVEILLLNFIYVIGCSEKTYIFWVYNI
jgi:hypothetical protein